MGGPQCHEYVHDVPRGLGLKSSPALADLDSDGDLDVVIGSYDGTVAFLENTGSREAPTFEKNDNLLAAVTGKGYTHPKPTLADVDNDGAVDLIVGQLQCGYQPAGCLRREI